MTYPQPSDGFEWTQEPLGMALRCAPLAEVARHLFTTRDLRLRDGPAEWAAVAASMGVAPDRVLLIRQVHHAGVAAVRQGARGPWVRPDADIIISDDRASAIAVRVADCAPILIADRRRPVVAAAHAGWRGTLRGAAAAAVRAMRDEFGSDPAELIAAIGPCLGPCCGEVGEEVVQAFRDAGHGQASIERWFATGASGRPYLDLWQANRDQLEEAGVRAPAVHVARLCTKTHAAVLHSYRADGMSGGRIAAVIRPGRSPAGAHLYTASSIGVRRGFE